MRGDGNGKPNLNFNQLYHLRGEDNSFLMEWAKRKENNYTSHDIHKEMLKVMTPKILRRIAAEIRTTEFYATMGNETSDISNTEQFVICIRWVDDDLNSREEFIGLHSLGITNPHTIPKVIKDILLRMNISLKKCCSQCYKGCSAMKSLELQNRPRISKKKHFLLAVHKCPQLSCRWCH